MKHSRGLTEEAVTRRPACPCGKIGWDKRGAQTKRNSLLKRGNRAEFRIYQCDESDTWHLTKQLRRNA